MLENKPILKKQIEDISDVFSGADGGVSYAQVCAFLEEMHNRHENGDRDAGQILNMVTRFHSIIQYVQNGKKP